VTTLSISAIAAAFLPKLNSRRPRQSGSSPTERKLAGEPHGEKMPRSVTSVFSEPADFEAALRAEGCLGLLVTGSGEFRARLTQVALHRLRLSATEEQLPRTALFAVPADMILVSLARGRASAPIWGGVRLGTDEIMTLGAGQRLHMRTDGPCRWGSIWLPATELVQYGRVLTGANFAVPSAARWRRPRPAMSRHLRHLHSAAIGLVERRSNAFIGGEAAHGLEQQLIETLVECLSKGSPIEATGATIEHQDIAVRFDALLHTRPERALRIAEIPAMLGVSARALRIGCQQQLGMGPAEYVRRRRMQQLDRAVERSGPCMVHVGAE
jgi:AraC-like DNA-binding protein